MKSFSLLITSAPFDSGIAYTAYKFAESLCAMGHQLNGVFFYQAGVHHANNLLSVAADETNLHQLWTELANQHQFPLYTCVTAANRRGILSQQDADDNDKTHFNLAAPFQQVGLGEWITLSNQSDRVVQF